VVAGASPQRGAGDGSLRSGPAGGIAAKPGECAWLSARTAAWGGGAIGVGAETGNPGADDAAVSKLRGPATSAIGGSGGMGVKPRGCGKAGAESEPTVAAWPSPGSMANSALHFVQRNRRPATSRSSGTRKRVRQDGQLAIIDHGMPVRRQYDRVAFAAQLSFGTGARRVSGTRRPAAAGRRSAYIGTPLRNGRGAM